MNAQKIISECDLFNLLRMSEDLFSSVETCELMEKAINHFTTRITRLSNKQQSKTELLRLYANLRGRLERMKLSYADYPVKLMYLNSVISYLDVERRIVLLQLRYPILTTERKPRCRSPFYWSSAYTPTDLMEMVSALHAAGVICKADGSPVELNKLIRTFEYLFNISIKNPERCRYATLNRKVRITQFLDTLRQAFIELCQR